MSIIPNDETSYSNETSLISVIDEECNNIKKKTKLSPYKKEKTSINWNYLLDNIKEIKDQTELEKAELELKCEMLQEEKDILTKKNAAYKKNIAKLVEKNNMLLDLLKDNNIEIDSSHQNKYLSLLKNNDVALIEEEINNIEKIAKDKTRIKNIIQKFDVKDLIEDLGIQKESINHIVCKQTDHNVDNKDEVKSIGLHLNTITKLKAFDIDYHPFCLTVSEDCVATLTDIPQNKKYYMRDHLGPLYSCEVNIANERVYTAGYEGIVNSWSITSILQSKPKNYKYNLHDDIIWDMLSLDDQNLITVGNDKKDVIWKPYTDGEYKIIHKIHNDHYCHNMIYQDQSSKNTIYLNRKNETLFDIYDINSTKYKDEISFDIQNDYFTSINGHVNSPYLVVGCESGALFLSDIKTKSKIARKSTFKNAILDICFVNDNYFIISDTTNEIKLIDLRELKTVSSYNLPGSHEQYGINCLALSKDNHIYAGGVNGVLYYLNLNNKI